MKLNLTWDAAKRQAALQDRGLDFADAAEVFAQAVYEMEDARQDYGEKRMILETSVDRLPGCVTWWF